jgi:hypothetical protein
MPQAQGPSPVLLPQGVLRGTATAAGLQMLAVQKIVTSYFPNFNWLLIEFLFKIYVPHFDLFGFLSCRTCLLLKRRENI